MSKANPVLCGHANEVPYRCICADDCYCKSHTCAPVDPSWPEFTLGLRMGGIMEDPEWHVEIIRTVKAPNLRAAKQKWAENTGHANKKDWNEEQQTYWGWSVVQVDTIICRHCEKTQ